VSAPEPVASPPPDDAWHAPAEAAPPAHVVVQVRLRDETVAYASWTPARGLWASTPDPMPPEAVVAWRRAPSLR
jgi:hypothetical protein